MRKTLLASLVSLSATTAQAQTPNLEEMWQIIQQQQAEIANLKSQLSASKQRIEETVVKTDATVAAVEQFSLAPAAANKTSLGGYGEMHYNNLEKDNKSSSKDEIDFHRFVFFAGHKFSDSVRFFSEVELEHSIAGEGKDGEAELEQAYIEWDINNNHRAKAGLFLVPVGLINETHEPNTFYGTERNNVEKNIIPATWWEGGAALSGTLTEGLLYDVAVHSGLALGDGKYKIRDGRRKVSEAPADDLAYTARIKYTAIPGLELGASLQYQNDLWQSEGPAKLDATLFEAHAAWQQDNFSLRALYAQWDIDDAIELVSAGADEQSGFYIEPSYRINEQLGLFARYSEWDNNAGTSASTETEQWDIGLNYWLHPNVVFKLDYQDQKKANDSGEDGFNIGVGYSF